MEVNMNFNPDKIKRILLSRTDSIGDVALTLPMCVWLKERFPNVELVYLGKSYTKSVISKFAPVDFFEDWSLIEQMNEDEQLRYIKQLELDAIVHVFPNKKIAYLAREAGIPIRIGTAHRGFHWLTCNRRVHFSRKRSDLHESQLNFKLLIPFGLNAVPSLPEIEQLIIGRFISSETHMPFGLQAIMASNQKRIILHPKSQGSALEWPIDKFVELALNLALSGYQVVFSGTESEGSLIREKLPEHDNIVDLTGKLSLDQYMFLIQSSEALVACSTGPLHLAGLSGIHAIGLFSPRRPIHPGRWKPLGKKVSILVYDQNCTSCRDGKSCKCIANIPVSEVERLVL